MASLGVASFGSAHRPLALAARTMGDLDLAVAHLEAAVVAELAIGDAPWHAMALARSGRRPRRARRPGDAERAGELRAEAVAAARRLGMDRRARQWQRTSRWPMPMSAGTGGCGRCSVAGRSATVPHCVGLQYLAELVANPDVEIDAIALASGHAVGPGGRDDRCSTPKRWLNTVAASRSCTPRSTTPKPAPTSSERRKPDRTRPVHRPARPLDRAPRHRPTVRRRRRAGEGLGAQGDQAGAAGDRRRRSCALRATGRSSRHRNAVPVHARLIHPAQPAAAPFERTGRPGRTRAAASPCRYRCPPLLSGHARAKRSSARGAHVAQSPPARPRK